MRWAERLGEEREEEEKEKEEEERRLRGERKGEEGEGGGGEGEGCSTRPAGLPAAGEVAPSPGPRHISAGLEWLLQPRL